MLRADNVICGTSTTGSGALTLAACPAPPGGIDPYDWLTNVGFANGNNVPVSYTLIEYTDATFVTAKQSEKGLGTVAVGASLTASTLTRTNVQTTATSLNGTPVPVLRPLTITSYTYNSGTGVVTLTMSAAISFGAGTQICIAGLNLRDLNGVYSAASASGTTVTYTAATGVSGTASGGGFLTLPITVGTAANTLIFVAPSSLDFPAYSPYMMRSDLSTCFTPMQCTTSTSSAGVTSGNEVFVLVTTCFPMPVARMGVFVVGTYSGGTADVAGRLYYVGANAMPGGLIADFGKMGTAGSAFASSTIIKTAALSTPIMLPPGEYFANFSSVFSGGTGTPSWKTAVFPSSGRLGFFTASNAPAVGLTASSATVGAAPDPANITGLFCNSSSMPVPLLFPV